MSKSSRPLELLKRKIYSSIINDDLHYLDLLEAKFSGKPLRSQLFTIIYNCYNEAALRNVPLSDKMKLKVEVYLLELYPYGDDASYLSVELVQRKINEMRRKMEELNCYERQVDQRFLYVITSLAQDIHLLKRLLKSTYDRIPWEEVEFCAAVFVLSRRSFNETNLYCHAYLSVKRILAHLGLLLVLLESFAESLNGDTDLSELAKVPENLRRDDVVKFIRERNPETSLLYQDFNRLRDIHSLDIIDSHLDLVKSSDPTELCGRIVILRSLQIVGEHLKNSLVTPKLSQNSIELIINTMKTYTWQIVKKIRDRISHNILQIVPMVSNDIDLFVNVKHDLEKTGDFVRGLLSRLKLNGFTDFFNKFKECLNSDKPNEVWDSLDFIDTEKFDQLIKTYDLSKTKLEAMLKQLNNSCFTKQSKIRLHDAFSNTHSNVRQYELNHYNKFLILDHSLKAMKKLKYIRHEPQLQQLINKEMLGLKFQNDFYRVQEMATLDLYSLANSMSKEEETILVKRVFNLITDYKSAKSIEVLGGKWERSLKKEKTKTLNETELANYWMFLEDKLELRNLTASLKTKGDAGTRVLMEVYILLKLSCLERKTPLPDIYRSFEKYPKILTGNYLRNHVAHNNIINEILQLDTTVTLIANAISLYKTQKLGNANYINMSVAVKTFDNFNNYENDIRIIETQKELFDAISAGDFNYIKNIHIDDIKVRDIKSRSLLHLAVFSEKHGVLETMFKLFPIHFLISSLDINFESPLHIAARLDRWKAAEFLLKHGARNDLMDRNGFFPIHSAAASGSQKALEAILKKSNDCVDEYKTDLDGYTALHLAVMYGHSTLVEVLINKNANVKELTYEGVSPLCFAFAIGSEDLVRTLVSHGADMYQEKDLSYILFAAVVNGNERILEYLLNNDIGETGIYKTNEYSLLHAASLAGSRRLVEIILERYGVDVDATSIGKETPLHFAIKGLRHIYLCEKKGDDYLAVIKLLIAKGCSINARTIDDHTPLIMSLEHTSLTRLLLESGADVNAPNMSMGLTALHVALYSGYSDTVSLLLEKCSDINVTDNQGMSPLHFAVGCDDNIDIVIMLISRGLSINVEDNEGNVPLHIAAACNSKSITSFLLNITDISVNKSNKNGCTPLHFAAKGGFLDIVKALVDKGASVDVFDTHGNSPLHAAIKGGNIDTVKILVTMSDDISKANDIGMSPLATALVCDKENIVDFLLEKNVYIDDEAINRAILCSHSRLNKIFKILKKKINSTESCSNLVSGSSSVFTRMLFFACSWSTPDVVQLISKSTCVNVENESGCTPLHLAILKGDVDIIKILLNRGADISAKGKVNISPLLLAISRDELTIVKIFFEFRSISINDKDEMGFSLLHYAVSFGVKSIVCFLLNNGADFHVCNNDGFNSIQWAAVKGFDNILQIFINEKYDFKSDIGPAGSTLLHMAAKNGNCKVIKFLLKFKVEVDARDEYGDTPLNVALKNGHKDAAVILLTRGAQFTGIYDSNQLKPHIKKIIDSTKLLHIAVIKNNVNEVSKCFADGAVLDAVTEESETALHLAVRFGFGDIVKFLLKNNCDPNVKNKCAFTALHLASWTSNGDMVNDLLANGAVYDSPTDRGETPSILTQNRRIKETFNFIESMYARVRNSEAMLTETERNHIILNPWILHILQNVKDKESATILEVAYRSNYLYIEKLKKLLVGKLKLFFDIAMDLKSEQLFDHALYVVDVFLGKCRRLRRKNPVVFWDIITLKANLLRCTQSYDSALALLNKVLDEQIECLGEDHHVTLKTRAIKVESLMSSGRNDEALTVLMEIYDKEKSKNDKNNLNLYYTMVNIGKVLNDLGKYEEALRFSETALFEINRIGILSNSKTLEAEIVYIESLYGVERYNEAKKIISDIFHTIEKYNIDKKSPLYRTVLVHFFEMTRDREKSLVNFQRLLKEEKQYTSLKARIQNNILKICLTKYQFFKAFSFAKQFYEEGRPILGENHPQILKMKDTMNFLLSSEYRKLDKMLKVLQEELMTAIHRGDEAEVKKCLMKGANPNIRDDSGQTALHLSVIAGHTNIVRMILEKGADVSIKDKKNYTPLNYSIKKGFSDISDLLIANGAIDNTEFIS